MPDLVLPVDRSALLLVEMQNDIVHESNVGERGLGGVLAMAFKRSGRLSVMVATRSVTS